MTERRRYALVGTGSRAAEMFLGSISKRYLDVAEVVGVHDVNPFRAATIAGPPAGWRSSTPSIRCSTHRHLRAIRYRPGGDDDIAQAFTMLVGSYED